MIGHVLWRAMLCLAWLVVATGSFAQTPSADEARFEAKLDALVGNVELPLFAEAMTAMMRELRIGMPTFILVGVGRGAKLDERWRPGNLHYDRAFRLVEAAIRKEEQRAGPLFAWSRATFVRSFRPPWSIEDLEFLVEFSVTDDGKLLAEYVDTVTVPALLQGLRDAPFGTPALRARMEEIRLQARERFPQVSTRLTEARTRRPETVERAIRILDFENGEKLGEQTVKRMFDTSMTRIAQAVFDVMGDLREEAAGFRRSVEDPSEEGRT